MFKIKAIEEVFPSRCDGTNLLSSLFEEEKRLAEEDKESGFNAVMLTLHEGKGTSFMGIHPVFTFSDLFTGMSLNPDLYVADYLLLDDCACVNPVVNKLLSCIKDSDNESLPCYNNFPVSELTFQLLKKHGFRWFSSIPVTTRKLIITAAENKSVYDNVYYRKRFYIGSFLSYFQLYTFLSFSDIELIAENVNHQERRFSITLEIKCLAFQESEILKKIQIGGGVGKFIS